MVHGALLLLELHAGCLHRKRGMYYHSRSSHRRAKSRRLKAKSPKRILCLSETNGT